MRQQKLPPLLEASTKGALDAAVADFFFGTGTPLHISRLAPSYVILQLTPFIQEPASRCIVPFKQRMNASAFGHQPISQSLAGVLHRNPLFRDMIKKISLTKGLYTGPAYNTLRTDLLQNAKERVVQNLEPFFEQGRRVSGFVLLCDGWTDVQGGPLLNFCLSSPRGIHFLCAVDCSGHDKDGQFIFDSCQKCLRRLALSTSPAP